MDYGTINLILISGLLIWYNISIYNWIERDFLVPDQTEIKVDIESLKKDIENINNIQGRLDTAVLIN